MKNLTKGKINRLSRDIAIPASIGFFFNTMYNIMDTFFAGMISSVALAALTLSFPIFFIMIAFGNGISTGTTALIGNELGKGKKEMARLYATQAIVYGILFSVILAILGLLLSPHIFRLMDAGGEYLDISLQYINTILIGSVFIIMTFVLNSSLNASGNTRPYRNFLIAGFLLNVLLDPIFIFWLGFGVRGIALATVLINIGGVVYIAMKANREGILCLGCLKYIAPRIRIFREITYQGFPASLNMMTVALGFFVITYFLSRFSQDAVAAYGVALRIEQIFLLPTIGLNIATLSLVGQNYGAGKFRRVKEALSTNIKYGLLVTLLGGLIIFFTGTFLMRIFTQEARIVELGASYLAYAALMQWGYVLIFMHLSALQGMKRPLLAFWIGIYRQIIAPVMLFYPLAFYFGLGVKGIWLGIFISVWSGAVITVLYTKRKLKALLS